MESIISNVKNQMKYMSPSISGDTCVHCTVIHIPTILCLPDDSGLAATLSKPTLGTFELPDRLLVAFPPSRPYKARCALLELRHVTPSPQQIASFLVRASSLRLPSSLLAAFTPQYTVFASGHANLRSSSHGLGMTNPAVSSSSPSTSGLKLVPDERTAPYVAVIGAGGAGLAAGRLLHEEGCRVTIFDKSDEVGGVWRYRPEPEAHAPMCE